jgi:dTDP-4-dehydrorhamnose reductase
MTTSIHHDRLTVLVLGARGMLGHMLVRVLSTQHDVYGTTSARKDDAASLGNILEKEYWVDLLDVENWQAVEAAVYRIHPDVVINCIGVVKQKLNAEHIADAIYINSLLPHKLAQLCDVAGIRFIHISTDCVFEGTPGIKQLSNTPNATDVYGTTKRLGEVTYGKALTLRTGFVGRQLSGSEGLFEWVYSQREKTITGFKNAIYSGLTTMALARIIKQVIELNKSLVGLYQVASTPISKFDLISHLNFLWGLGLTIIPDTDFCCDRSLDGSLFSEVTSITIPSWDEMLVEFVKDDIWYTEYRENF